MRRLALLLLFLSAAPGVATPSPGPPAPDPTARLRDVSVLVDPSGTETIESVAAADPGRFRQLPGGNLAAGYTRDVHWLRFTLDAPPGEWWLDVLPPYLDDLRLFEPDPARAGRFRERRAGDLLPFSAREVPYRGFVFRLRVAPESPRVYYLRLSTTSTALLLPRIWAPDAFHARLPAEYAILLGLIAVLVVVAGMSLYSWSWLRERVYLLFSAYLVAMAVAFTGVGGFAAQYVLPDHPRWTDAWVGVATMAAFAAFGLWLREILQVTRARRLLWLACGVMPWLALAGVVASALGSYGPIARLVNLLAFVLTVAAVPATWRLWRRGLAGGALRFAAILLALLSLASSLLTLLGLVPGHLVLLYGPHLTAVASVLVLHFALAERYRTLHEERRMAEHDAARERQIREQQGRFLDLVTHEYRTPLAVLQANLDILGLAPDEAERSRSLGRMEAAVGRLGEIFDRRLREGDWGGASAIALETVSPVPMLRELAGRVLDPASGSAPVLDVRGDERLSVRADRRLLTTVLLNLLDNARKYAPAGSPLEVRVLRAGGCVVLRFANECATAPGVSTETLRRKYVRGDNGKGIAGLGLGLHLVDRLLGDQGGSLTLEIDPGGRFVAIVTLAQGEPEAGA